MKPPAAAAATADCTAAQLEIWLGDGAGGGTAGAVYYPLEFSNISHRSCALAGYPGLSAVNRSGKQVGPSAARFRAKARTITLKAGATAHALFAVTDWGAVCSKEDAAAGLKVYAPNVRTATFVEPFPFGACASRGVLRVYPVRAGTGIPGYTTS